MRLKSVLVASAVVTVVAGAVWSASPARAQDFRAKEAELVGFHQACDHGDRKACVRFGMLLQEMRDHHAEWRRGHPEWFWWER